MASANLPRFIVIKPAICNSYVCYETTETESGHVYCKGESVFNPYTKIELEQAKHNSRYYHLRFCQSNRYWAKSRVDRGIVAVSKQPDEETTKSSCTLFEPTLIDDKGVLHLIHVQSGIRVQTDTRNDLLFLDENGDDDVHSSGRSCSFTYVDWDELVKVPERVVFRGDNGKILRSVWCDGNPNLQFSSTDGNDGYSAQQVSLHPDGHVRIKSEHCSKFWRRDSSSIWTDSSDESGDDVDTLFWPVKLDSQTIALRNPRSGCFAKRFTNHNCDMIDILAAISDDISKFAKLVVEPLVDESFVHDVRYRMEDARVFDEQPYLVGVGTMINESDTDDNLTAKVLYQVTETSSFTHSYSLQTGVYVTFTAGIPLIVDGKIDTSFEDSGDLEWGSTTSDKKSGEVSFAMKVPAKSVAKVKYVGTRGKCSVPFSYTQTDRPYYNDGTHVTSYHNDGIFYGTNYYSFRFEQPVVEPL